MGRGKGTEYDYFIYFIHLQMSTYIRSQLVNCFPILSHLILTVNM